MPTEARAICRWSFPCYFSKACSYVGSDEFFDKPNERFFITAKTVYHRPQCLFRIHGLQMNRVARAIREQCEERELCAAVAFAERMYGVEFREKMCRIRCKFFLGKISERPFPLEFGKEPTHRVGNMFRIAKDISSF